MYIIIDFYFVKIYNKQLKYMYGGIPVEFKNFDSVVEQVVSIPQRRVVAVAGAADAEVIASVIDAYEQSVAEPILVGEKIPAIIAAVLIIIDCILCPLLYYYHIFGILYLAVIAIAVILFLYCAILILKNQDRQTCHKAAKLLKIGMLIAFVSFIFGSLM